MAKTDWNIFGTGGQAVIEYAGSKCCQISGQKYMIRNDAPGLTNCEIISDIIIPQNTTNARGGMVLRMNESGTSGYKLCIFGPRNYYIYKIVNNVVTVLANNIASSQPYNVFVKTRFRIDGYQMQLDEYWAAEWHNISTIVDDSQSISSGYAGLCGDSVNNSYYVTFDNVIISTRA